MTGARAGNMCSQSFELNRKWPKVEVGMDCCGNREIDRTELEVQWRQRISYSHEIPSVPKHTGYHESRQPKA